MPFYDYKCSDEKCGHQMPNQLKPFSAKVIKCEACEKETSTQQFSGMFAATGLPNGHNSIRGNIRRK
jgi:putative FmdB family regulatory protein